MPHGDTLVAFVDAVLADDDDARVAARRAMLDAVGPAGLVDAAAVIAAFTLQNRIADATGTPLDAPLELATRTLRAEIGADRFATAASTRKGGWPRALLARLVERLLPLALRLADRRKPPK